MPSQFIYKSGDHSFKDRLTTASTAIARGDALKKSSGKVLPMTTGTNFEGIAQGVKTSGDAATTAISVLKANPMETLFHANEKRASGSLAATDEGSLCDMTGASGAMGFDSSGTDDGTADIYLDTVLATGATDVGRALIAFADPAQLAYA